jgi:general secretion pathway protein A
VYLEHFGLKHEPFRATPDPAMLYLTAGHRDALAALSYAILMHKGFAVLTGDAGTGKTTVLSRIVQTMPRNRATFSVILNSVLTSAEFLESVMLDFGLKEIPASKAQRLQHLQKFLMAEYTAGRTCVLFIDEAQKLSEEVIEEIRLLSNCELPDRKLLQIVLSGQPELEAVLERQALRQFKQRVSIRLRIAPLSPAEMIEYIRFRWTKAGGAEPAPFDAAATAAIAAYTKGIPRVVNILCDNSLLLAFGAESRSVSLDHVDESAAALVLQRGTATAAAGALANTGSSSPNALVATKRDESAGPEALSTLRRYAPPPAPSRLSRWVAKLGRARHADGMI